MAPKSIRSELSQLRASSSDLAGLAAALQSRRRNVTIVAVEVRGKDEEETMVRMRRVYDIAASMGAEVPSTVSATVVIAFGMIQLLEQQKQVAKRLPERLKQEFGVDHRAIHTTQNVWCDHVCANPPTMALLWQGLPQMLSALQDVAWGCNAAYLGHHHQ